VNTAGSRCSTEAIVEIVDGNKQDIQFSSSAGLTGERRGEGQ
jgi:hypothetical protein